MYRIASLGFTIPILLFAATFLAPAHAFAAPQFTITFYVAGSETRSTGFSRNVTAPLPWSNGTGTFTGSAYAGPCSVIPLARTDCTWENGSSGAFGNATLASATADDFIITGPGGPTVHGTIHLRVSARFEYLGGYDGNGASGLFWFNAGSAYASAFGQVNFSKSIINGSGWLSGITAPSFDLDIPLTGDYPVNSPFQFHISTEADAGCYGNVYHNPGLSIVDGGAGNGVSLGSGGMVMDLPAGYTLNSAGWSIQGGVAGVGDEPRAATLQMELAGANPVLRNALFRLTLARASDVRVVLYDVLGHAVRSLYSGWQAEGPHNLLWDGRDDRGEDVASGLYFARASALGKTATIRVVRIR